MARLVPTLTAAMAHGTVYYDRILAIDAGRVVEFDAPLALFDRAGSVFRALCDEARLSQRDILRIRAGVTGRRSSVAEKAFESG